MKKIDTSCWKSFKITDIFHIKNTNCVLSRDVTPGSGRYPYVTASSVNNGVAYYVNVDPLLLDKGNCIFIGGKTLVFSYQKEDFVSNDSHNLALYLINKKFRNPNVYLFLIAVLKSSLAASYKWSDSISYKAILKDTIKLPVTSTGEPDFVYMENFINKISEQTRNHLNILSTINNLK